MPDDLIAMVNAASAGGEREFAESEEFVTIPGLRRSALENPSGPSVRQCQQACAAALARYPGEIPLALWWAEMSSLTKGFAGLAEGIALVAAVCAGPAAPAELGSDALRSLCGRIRELILSVQIASEGGHRCTFTTVLNARYDPPLAAATRAAVFRDRSGQAGLLSDLDALEASMQKFATCMDARGGPSCRDLFSLIHQVSDWVVDVNKMGSGYETTEQPREPAAEEPSPALGSCDIFLHIEGVPGDSVDSVYRGWIEALSYSHTINSAEPRLEIQKHLDRASPTLYKACSTGRTFPRVMFDFRGRYMMRVPLLRIELENAAISSILQAASADGFPRSRPTERLTFQYSRISWTYAHCGPDGLPEGFYSASVAIPSADGRKDVLR